MITSALIDHVYWLVAIFVVSAIASRLTPRHSSPVVGELLGGMILGNLYVFGVGIFEPMKRSGVLEILSQVGVSFLLFQIGLTSTVGEMRRIGMRASLVAVTGISCTLLLGIFFCRAAVPTTQSMTPLLIAASLAATSVGISARILRDLGWSGAKESHIIIGAAVIDDIISLLFLALFPVLFGLSGADSTSAGRVILTVALFIPGATLIGSLFAGLLIRVQHQSPTHNVLTMSIPFLFFIAFGLGAYVAGLPPIIGAFIGGLVLERKHFAMKGSEADETRWKLSELNVDRVGKVIVPIFFVMTGLRMDLSSMSSLSTIFIAVGLIAVAVLGKLACGLVAGKGVHRWLVGIGMIPRGEVALIYASMGLSLGLLPSGLYSAIVIVVIVTTILAPTLLARLITRSSIAL